MTFLNSPVLFALFALAIPVIIHLFNFRKAKRIYFSNTKLLRDVKEVTSSKRRLKHWLVLFSRLLFILFLVLAFAQPFIPASEQVTTERLKIYVDNSMSMLNQIVPGQTQQDLAITSLQEIIGLYPKETQIRLIDNTFESSSNLFYSRAELEDRITEISQTSVHRSLDEVIRRFDFRKEPGESSLNFIISDFQKSTSGDLSLLELDSQQVYYFLPIQGAPQNNVYLDTLYLATPFVREGENNRIIFKLNNRGDDEVNDLLIKLFVNDKQASSTGISIPPNSSATAEFELNFSLESINACRLSFEEFPVSFDNDFYFTLNQTKQINVLEIKPDAYPTPVENVFGNPSLFRFSSFVTGSLDYSAINQSDLIVLSGLNEIDEVLTPYLNEFLQKSGTILLIPSDEFDINSYKSLVPQITGINISELRSPLSSPDQQNPFFKNIFESSSRRFDMPDATPIMSWIRQGQDLLSFRQGSSFLTEITSNGSVFLMGSPLEDEYTNFHKHAIFVPVMYRIAVQSKSQSDFLYYTTDQEVITLKIDSLSRNDIFKLRKEEVELIPEQRIVGQDLIFEIPANSLSPGFYELVLGDVKKGIVSFNADKRESVLENYTSEELESAFENRPNVRVKEVEGINSLSKSIKEEQFGISLWKYCLFLALIFLLTEILLIKFL